MLLLFRNKYFYILRPQAEQTKITFVQARNNLLKVIYIHTMLIQNKIETLNIQIYKYIFTIIKS